MLRDRPTPDLLRRFRSIEPRSSTYHSFSLSIHHGYLRHFPRPFVSRSISFLLRTPNGRRGLRARYRELERRFVSLVDRRSSIVDCPSLTSLESRKCPSISHQRKGKRPGVHTPPATIATAAPTSSPILFPRRPLFSLGTFDSVLYILSTPPPPPTLLPISGYNFFGACKHDTVR